MEPYGYSGDIGNKSCISYLIKYFIGRGNGLREIYIGGRGQKVTASYATS